MYNSGNSSKNVTGSNIIDGTVETVDIADDAVTADKLATTVNADIATGVSGSTTAGDALPKAGGAMTGAITTNSTFDGRDVATDGTKLDTIVIGDTVAANEVTLNAQTGTAYTIVPTDNGKLVTLANSGAIALTIDTNANAPIDIGATIAFQQTLAGLVTMSGAGITFHNRNGLTSGGQYAVWSITKTATDTWLVAGDLV
jgi:hypothetical protein